MPINVSFQSIRKESEYTRTQLSRIWGYRSAEAITRGVVTPSRSFRVVLFITINKEKSQPQYQDELRGRTLIMDGENKHGSDLRLVATATNGDEVHLFFRHHYEDDFTYKGEVRLVHHELRTKTPSLFIFALRG